MEEEESSIAQENETEDRSESPIPSDALSDHEGEPSNEKADDVGTADAREIKRAAAQNARKDKQEEKKHLEEQRDEQNRAVDEDTSRTAKARLKFLLEQTELYTHFMSPTKGAKSPHETGKGKGGRRGHGVAEQEEDETLLKEALDDEEPSHQHYSRLIVQPPSITGKMREYQLEGLNWLIKLYENGINGILADEMGLGKTLQSISLLAFLHDFKRISGPHLIITPKSTLGNWMNEIKRWCPALRPFKFHGSKDERAEQREHGLVVGKFDVCVTTYEVAIKEKPALKKFSWRYLIIDEAHRIKNENSVLSQVVRLYASTHRLLITGTPLQNNLHELWALLNFLLPEVFNSSGDFESWFNLGGGEVKTEIVQQLHKVLRPFLLRRLKVDVEKSIPPKRVMQLYVGLSAMQKDLYRKILQRDLEAVNGTGDRVRLLNILMQCRKACNHPYLFDGMEPRFNGMYTTDEHLIHNCGKMVLIDKLLPRLKAEGSRVLLFSQMTRVLDILEDYCNLRKYEYCRIDGNTDGDVREEAIASYNAPNSSKFLFLLSTRAGGLGINLATANIVVLYDSDWNPQVDLQAQDRAHRIGQTKPVTVYRLVTEDTIEEKIVERAETKLRLDAVVIQQGRLADQSKALTKTQLLDIVRFGAENIFRSKDSSVSEEDIDRILEKGQAKTKELNAKLGKINDDSSLNLSLETGTSFQTFEGVDYSKSKGFSMNGGFWLEPPKRERKAGLYSENKPPRTNEANRSMRGGPKAPAKINVQDFQFYNLTRLKEIYEKEFAIYQYELEKFTKGTVSPVPQEGDDNDAAAESDAPPAITPEEVQEKQKLLSMGFSDWSKKDFAAFVRGCEKYGRSDLVNVTKEVEGKTEDQVRKYASTFWKRYKELNDWEKTVKTIEKGETRIKRRIEMMRAIETKVRRYKNPLVEMKLNYGGQRGKTFTEEEDRFLVYMVHELGYGAWEQLKLEVRRAPIFRFDYFIKSRTPQELCRRFEILVRLIEKENEELDVKEKETTGTGRGRKAAVKKEKEPAPTAPPPAKTTAPAASTTTSKKRGAPAPVVQQEELTTGTKRQRKR